MNYEISIKIDQRFFVTWLAHKHYTSVNSVLVMKKYILSLGGKSEVSQQHPSALRLDKNLPTRGHPSTLPDPTY